MESIENRLRNVFCKALRFESTKITDDLTFGIKGWDSVGHMVLISAIESEFDIMLDTNDVIDMSSFKRAKEIIGKYEF